MSEHAIHATPSVRPADALLGAIAAPFAGSFSAAIAGAGYALVFEHVGLHSLESVVMAVFFVAMAGFYASLFGLALAIILGLPLHALLHRLHVSHIAAYVVSGTATALVGTWASPWRMDMSVQIESWAALTILFPAFAGAVGGLVFWLIRRPDRDPRPPA